MRWLLCGCWRFIFEEAFVVAQLNDRCFFLVRQEVVVQVKVQIPLVLFGGFRFGLYHMRARTLVYRLRRFDLLARAQTKKVLLLFRIAPVDVGSGVSAYCSISDGVISDCRPNSLRHGCLQRRFLWFPTKIKGVVAGSAPLISLRVCYQRHFDTIRHSILQSCGLSLVLVVLLGMLFGFRLFFRTFL